MTRQRWLCCMGLALAAIGGMGFDHGNIPAEVLPHWGEWWQNVQWHDPGGWTTVDVSEHGLPAGRPHIDAAEVINRLIAETKGNVIIQLPPGKYYARGRIRIERSGVRVRGAGRELSRLYLDGDPGAAGIVIRGDRTENPPIHVLPPAPRRGDEQVRVDDASLLSPGGFIDVYQTRARGEDLWEKPHLMGKLCRIAEVSGQTITLDRPLPMDYDMAAEPRISRLAPVRNVSIEDLYLEKARDTRDYTIAVFYGQNLRFRNVHSFMTSRAHLYLYQSQDVTIEGCRFHHSFDYGRGGHGYGILMGNKTTRCRVTNNALWSLRHAIVLQRFANFNVISHNFLRSDEGAMDERFHGNYAYANLFEGNDALRIVADRAHGINGPYNTCYRNRALFIGGPDWAAEHPFTVVANTVNTDPEGSFLAAWKRPPRIHWGAMTAEDLYPPSLYLAEKPDFFGARSWPAYGPGTDAYWGQFVELPAEPVLTARNSPVLPTR